MTKQSPDFWRKIAAMLVAKHGGTETQMRRASTGKRSWSSKVASAAKKITLHVVTPEQAAAMARELESTHDKD